jgi:hypothetical protein
MRRREVSCDRGAHRHFAHRAGEKVRQKPLSGKHQTEIAKLPNSQRDMGGGGCLPPQSEV